MKKALADKKLAKQMKKTLEENEGTREIAGYMQFDQEGNPIDIKP